MRNLRCLLIGILLLFPAKAWCYTVHFPVMESQKGVLFQGPHDITLHSSELDGWVLAGQSLSLDLVLGDDVLARLLLGKPQALSISFIIQTDAKTFPGFAGPTSGYLLDRYGYQRGAVQSAGRASGNSGAISVGLVSFTRDNLGGPGAVGVSGIHLDTILPNSGFNVTDARLRFSLNSPLNRLRFGTLEQLPEYPSVGLVLTGLVALASMTRLRQR